MLLPQASDNAKVAEDNARKAKNAVKMVLGTIGALLEQLGRKPRLLPVSHQSISQSINQKELTS